MRRSSVFTFFISTPAGIAGLLVARLGGQWPWMTPAAAALWVVSFYFAMGAGVEIVRESGEPESKKPEGCGT